MAEKKSLFDVLYAGLAATISTMKRPLIERSINRRFDSFTDGCDKTIDDLEMKVSKLLEEGIKTPEKLDIQQIAEIKLEMAQIAELQHAAIALKTELFDSKIDVQ